jgi:hypothetical protein
VKSASAPNTGDRNAKRKVYTEVTDGVMLEGRFVGMSAPRKFSFRANRERGRGGS